LVVVVAAVVSAASAAVVLYTEWSERVKPKALALRFLSHFFVTQHCHVEGETAP
jgi:hypothetical protein